MKYVMIPDTTLNVSRIGFGTTNLGVNQTQAQADDLLNHYLAAGGNYIDTALTYSDWIKGEKSRSEKALGEWIASTGKRDQYYIGTKGAHPGFVPVKVPRVNQACVAADIDSSLQNLKTDYIDLYWLHRDDTEKSVEEILGFLEEFVQSGKIRYYACSNWTVDRVQEAYEVAKAKGWRGFVGNQLEWNSTIVNRENVRDKTMTSMDAKTLQFHQESQMAVFSFTSQAAGLFDRLYEGGYDNVPDFMQAKYWNDATEGVYEIIRANVQALEITPTQFAVAYLHARKDAFPLVTLAGTSSVERLASIMKIGDIELPADLVAQVSALLFPQK